MIHRTLQAKLIELAEKFPIVTLTGPRQSGKTTLVQAAFPSLPYVTLEAPDIRQFALSDPRGFLANYNQGAILDEIQRVPDLFSYIQTMVDADPGLQYVLTGSANFLLLEQIGQSLAGRSAILSLLPFSLAELAASGRTFEQVEAAIFTGQYPRIYDRHIPPADFYPAYIQTYVERDVRLLKNISDLNSFVRFTQLCAGRTGQLINYTSLANDAGISPNTAKSWLSVLEAAYIVYFLRPFHKNFNKRLVKSPKLYFFDTGLACSLLGLQHAEQVTTHYLKGALFENLILNELMKAHLHCGHRNVSYFWQDSRGNDVDCVLVNRDAVTLVEMKAGKTISDSYFRNIQYWHQLQTGLDTTAYVVYGGKQSLSMPNGHLLSWRALNQLINHLLTD